MEKPVAKRILKRFQPKEKDKSKEKEKKSKKRNKENAAMFQDPYEEEYPWRVPPMSQKEILRAIKDGPSLNELIKRGEHQDNELDPEKKYVTVGASKIEESELDQISPKTHNEQFYESIPFNSIEDFTKSEYYKDFAAKGLREVPLTKEDFEPDKFSLL